MVGMLRLTSVPALSDLATHSSTVTEVHEYALISTNSAGPD
jgi:hypothetical protein